jgi:membrane fusion protein (multidrug efflux system)
MATLIKRFGFAAVVTLVIGAMAFVVVGKTLFGKEEAGGPAIAAKAGPPGAAGKGGSKGGDMPVVVAGTVAQSTFYDTVQAIGTAQAKESVIIGAKVTDVISRIRFDSGDRVSRGQVLVELASTEQFADLEEARASREAARRDYDRFRELGEKGFAPAQRVEQARAGFEQAEARVRALQARVGDRTIRAPFSGVMGLRTASPGALVRPGDQIGTLDDISEIKLDFDVSESQFGQIRAGSEIAAVTPAHPGKTFTGRVSDIDSRVNTQSRTVRVRAIIPNREGLLKPGMLMSVEARSNPRQALGAPEIAVLERADGSYIFALEDKDGKPTAALTFVRTGKRSGGLVEILSGVAPGTRLVVEGVQRVRSGQAVRIEARPTAVAPAATPPPAPVAPPKAPIVRKERAPPPTAPATTESELRGRVQEPVAPPEAAAPGGQLPPVPAD